MSAIEDYPVEPETASEPFIIRPHHLQQVQYMLRRFESPEERAAALATDVRRRQDSPILAGDRAYTTDVLGPNLEGLDKHRNGTAAFLKEFVELPPDAPVRLVAQPDGICDSCYFGNHCQEELSDPENADFHYFMFFAEIGRRLHLEDYYVAAYDSDAPVDRMTPTISIDTTAGTARTIAAHPDFADYSVWEANRQKYEKWDRRLQKIGAIVTALGAVDILRAYTALRGSKSDASAYADER